MDETIESDDSVNSTTVTVKVKPDLGELRSFLSDMLAVIDKYDTTSSD